MSFPDSPADGSDPDGPSGTRSPTSPRPHGSPVLRLTVVRRDIGPDRATVHPAGATGMARMETWLSVDRAAVVELSAWR